MTKIYLYNEQGEDNPLEITDEQIINDYYPYWESRMIKKFGEGHELITRENCIEDWIIINWAWEKINESYGILSGDS
ncbi:MAG: hypothetical protein NTZ20_04795 [Candidatus Levybacteria bacterium]|nr:hypothetical protein [Candidatus Levybacteria bacterium]